MAKQPGFLSNFDTNSLVKHASGGRILKAPAIYTRVRARTIIIEPVYPYPYFKIHSQRYDTGTGMYIRAY
jgi:hypothetical protein